MSEELEMAPQSPAWSARRPRRLLRTAINYCARCDMNHQFNVGLDLIVRGLETECPGPDRASLRSCHRSTPGNLAGRKLRQPGPRSCRAARQRAEEPLPELDGGLLAQDLAVQT